MYGVPPRGHFQGQTRDNSNTRFFTLKRNMRSYIIFVIYICRFVSCLKGFALFYYIPHTYSTHNAFVAGHLLNIKKRENGRMPIRKAKHVQLF